MRTPSVEAQPSIEVLKQLPVDVVILAAITVELRALLIALSLGEAQKEVVGTLVVYRGLVNGRNRKLRVVVACIGQPGNYSSALRTSKLIELFKPKLMLLMGIAAGDRAKVKIGQVVIAERVVYYEQAALTVTRRGEQQRQTRHDSERPSGLPWQSALNYDPDVERLRKQFEVQGGKAPTPEWNQKRDFRNHVAEPVMFAYSPITIASGEKLLRDPDFLPWARENLHGKIEVGEMEAAGFALACEEADTAWLVFRGISDFGDSFKNDAFHPYASAAVATVVVDFIQHGLLLPEEKTILVAGPCPYLGLQAYSYADRAIYAGRKQLIDEVVAQITEQGLGFYVITGASGSGKSSLARAGLLPALENHYRKKGHTLHSVEDWQPGRAPLQGLLQALETLNLPVGQLSPATIRSDPDQVIEVLKTAPDQPMVLVIDQFEEFFSQADVGDRDACFAIFRALLASHPAPVHCIATIRGDFLNDLEAQLPIEAQPTKRLGGQNLIYQAADGQIVAVGRSLGPMTDKEVTQAIRLPLAQMNALYGTLFEFDPKSLERLAIETAVYADHLPLLQATLERLWQEEKQLRLPADYYGIADALALRASDVYNDKHTPAGRLPRTEVEKSLLLELLCELVELPERKDADPQRKTSWPRPKADLIAAQPGYAALIDELVDARLLWVTNHAEREYVQLSHETLLQRWDLFQHTLNRDTAIRELILQRVAFDRQLRGWLTNKRQPKHLLGAEQLREAKTLEQRNDSGDSVVQSAEAREFLQTSRAALAAQQRRLIFGLLSIPLILSLIVAGLYGIGYSSYHFYSERDEVLNSEMVVLRRGPAWLAWLPQIGDTVVYTGVNRTQIEPERWNEIIGQGLGGWWLQQAPDGYALWGEQLVERMTPQNRIDWRWNLGQRDEARSELITALGEPESRAWAVQAAYVILAFYPEQARADLISAQLAQLTDDQDINVRAAVAGALGLAFTANSDAATPDAVAALLARLVDASFDVRSAVAQALGAAFAANPELVRDALLDRLDDDQDSNVRSAVAQALGAAFTANPDTATLDAIAALLARLDDDQDSNVRSAVAQALGAAFTANPDTATLDAIAALLARLDDDQDSNVRSAVAQALGAAFTANPDTATLDAIVALLARLDDDQDSNVRSAVAQALGAAFTANPDAATPDAIAALLARLVDASFDVRSAVAQTLEVAFATNPQLVRDALLDRLDDDQDSNVRSAVAQALGVAFTANPDTATLDAIAALLARLDDDQDSNVRSAVAQALGAAFTANPDAATLDAIAALLARLGDDQDSNVRYHVAGTLGVAFTANPDTATLDAIAALLTDLDDDQESSVLSAVARALGAAFTANPDAANPDVIAALLDRLEDASFDVRSAVAQALGAAFTANPDAATPDAIAALLARLDDGFTVRSDVAQALGAAFAAAPDAATSNAIAALLARLDGDVHSAVARALGAAFTANPDAATPDAVAALLARLDDAEDSDVRSAVARALGAAFTANPDAATPDVIAALLVRLNDGYSTIAQALRISATNIASAQSSLLAGAANERASARIREYFAGGLYMHALSDPKWYADSPINSDLPETFLAARTSTDPIARYWAHRTLALLDLASLTHHAAWLDEKPQLLDLGLAGGKTTLGQLTDYRDWAQDEANNWLGEVQTNLAKGQLIESPDRVTEAQGPTITALAATGQAQATTIAQQVQATQSAIRVLYATEAPDVFAAIGPKLTAIAVRNPTATPRPTAPATVTPPASPSPSSTATPNSTALAQASATAAVQQTQQVAVQQTQAAIQQTQAADSAASICDTGIVQQLDLEGIPLRKRPGEDVSAYGSSLYNGQRISVRCDEQTIDGKVWVEVIVQTNAALLIGWVEKDALGIIAAYPGPTNTNPYPGPTAIP